MSSSKSEKMQLAPMRPLGDFLLDTNRYLAPTFNDLKRFNNRVISNLLYYQTNYITLSTLVFLIFTLFQFNRILIGLIGVAVTAAAALFTLDKIPQARSIRAQYPFAKFAGWGIDAIVLYVTFRPILFLTLIILVPIAFAIIHASMRSRGIKNKISNKMEQLGASVYTNTPMGSLLVLLGFEAKDYDE